MTARDATVSAVTQGTFVTIAGQNINDLTVTTDYMDQQVTFDGTAKQPQRTVAAAGSFVMHPDHNEVHLQRLSLATQGMTWQTLPGSEATIQYANNDVKVENFRLVNGDQQIAADGAYGRAGDSLKVRATNVDVGMIDALLLRPPQLSGRLNATGDVTSDGAPGSTPQVKADFNIEKGGFRKFQYDSFGGTVNYAGNAMTLDTKLQQSPAAWLDVKGRVPTALFSSTGSGLSEPIDLFVDSTPIDAGLVQGFTTSFTNVTGTLEAHVHVTGSAGDPRPDGTITIQNAAFRFEPNGVPYTQLDGKIDLQPDRVHIDQIRVLDNQRKPLTLTGDLAIHEFQVGGLSIAVKAADFKVIDNEMGNVRINSDLRLTGQLTAPRIEGDLGVTTGVINLDPDPEPRRHLRVFHSTDRIPHARKRTGGGPRQPDPAAGAGRSRYGGHHRSAAGGRADDRAGRSGDQSQRPASARQPDQSWRAQRDARRQSVCRKNALRSDAHLGDRQYHTRHL